VYINRSPNNFFGYLIDLFCLYHFYPSALSVGSAVINLLTLADDLEQQNPRRDSRVERFGAARHRDLHAGIGQL
jgi:hypothetical protein